MSTFLQKSRHYLTEGDMEFVLGVLSQSVQERAGLQQLLYDPEELDQVLDSPALWTALWDRRISYRGTARLYFYLLVRHALLEVGLEDRDTAEYVANMLADQGQADNWLFPFSDRQARFLHSVDYLRDLQAASGSQRFFLHASAGNHYLFMTAFFARFIEQREERRGAPGIGYYEQVGIHSYEHARDHRLAKEYALADTFDRLAQHFPPVRRKLAEYAERFRHN